MATKPVVIDLFAGAGIFSHALAQEGFRIGLAVEIERAASKTYRHNLGEHLVTADVLTVEPHGHCDVLIGGPPCQGFSTLGAQDPRDPRSRLSLVMPDWAEHLRPKVVVVENVDAFLDTSVCQTLVRRFKSLGYEVATHSVDALDFGAPQRRRRAFVIASLVGLMPLTPLRIRKVRTVREAWEGLSSRPNGVNNHYAPTPSSLALARMRVIPRGGDKRSIMERAPHLAPASWRRVACEATDVWGRLRWDEPSNTLRTTLQNPSKGRYIHPQQNRVISLREAARLHSIPDDFEFVGTPYQIARQIGNSVPTALGRAVARLALRLVA